MTDVEICGPSGMLPTAGVHACAMDSSSPARNRPRSTPSSSPSPWTTLRRRNRKHARRPPPGRRVYWVLPPEYHDWMVSQGFPLAPPDGPTTQTVAAGSEQERLGMSLVLTRPDINTAYQLHQPACGQPSRRRL
ncbi:MAG: hypothetical protein R3A10_23140 [Caldilineaceae bacterium]